MWDALGVLDEALYAAVEARTVPPCWGPQKALWTAENVQERAQAALLCRGCPVITECGRAADAIGEQWHVWAGIDRTRKVGRQRLAS
jgi:hypothetical protein